MRPEILGSSLTSCWALRFLRWARAAAGSRGLPTFWPVGFLFCCVGLTRAGAAGVVLKGREEGLAAGDDDDNDGVVVTPAAVARKMPARRPFWAGLPDSGRRRPRRPFCVNIMSVFEGGEARVACVV